TRFIAAMQLGIHGAGERFRVMRDNADAGEILRSGDVRMGDDMALSQGLVIRAKLGAQILIIPPTPNDELYVGGVMFSEHARAFENPTPCGLTQTQFSRDRNQ